MFANGTEIQSTSNHPFFERGSNVWTPAANLAKGDLLQRFDGEVEEIAEISTGTEITSVFNLSIDELHNFYVGSNSVLVHNANCFTIKSRIKENKKLAKAAEKAGKNAGVQKDLDIGVKKLSEGNLNPGKGTKPIGRGLSEARFESGARIYFRVVKGEIEILGKSSKANQDEVIELVLQTFK